MSGLLMKSSCEIQIGNFPQAEKTLQICADKNGMNVTIKLVFLSLRRVF